MKILFTAAALTVLSGVIAEAQDIGKGATVFKQCAICHRLVRMQRTVSDPNSNGLDGRHSGGVPSYSYSDANKKSGMVWSEQTFAVISRIRERRSPAPDGIRSD